MDQVRLTDWDNLEMPQWRRLVSAEETLDRVKPLFPLFGITRVANVTGLDTIGIPVVMVNRPNSRALAVSQGKGVTLAAAKASAVMESIESWHAERCTHLSLRIGSYEDLRYSLPMVDPDRLPANTDSAYSPHHQMLWAEGTNLRDGNSLWIPYEMVHTNYTLPLPTGHGCFQANSNGLASGNHWIEAVIHGLSEVIERDARTLWNQLPEEAQEETRVDLETIADPTCRALLARFAHAGVAVGVWDMTSDVGVPTFLARIVQANAGAGTTVRPACGYGTHLVPEIALSRALTEAAQSRLTFISGARDDMRREEYDHFLAEEQQALWLNRIRLGTTVRDFNEFEGWQGQSLRGDLEELRRRLDNVGIEDVVVVDLTRAEIGIPVVRVVVPGLEGVDNTPNYALGARGRRAAGLA
ncbi:YcaO-like family protein [Niveispirillum sp. KHB5.9]|uniref:YcaO-like family protein n=1 Tax=Niveispirillum sp. KHB5.9 TaxID=3400269 RepID=UPI003A8866A7